MLMTQESAQKNSVCWVSKSCLPKGCFGGLLIFQPQPTSFISTPLLGIRPHQVAHRTLMWHLHSLDGWPALLQAPLKNQRPSSCFASFTIYVSKKMKTLRFSVFQFSATHHLYSGNVFPSSQRPPEPQPHFGRPPVFYRYSGHHQEC